MSMTVMFDEIFSAPGPHEETTHPRRSRTSARHYDQ